jgi:hypothetical protein
VLFTIDATVENPILNKKAKLLKDGPVAKYLKQYDTYINT